MLKHQVQYYVPPTLLKRLGDPRNLPEAWNSVHDKSSYMKEIEKKAHEAIAKTSQIFLDMEFMKIGFAPVQVRLEKIVENAHLTDFYRSVALFEKFFKPDWFIFENDEEVARLFRKRIFMLGNSPEGHIKDFFIRESPVDGYCPYETQCFIEKLKHWPADTDDEKTDFED